MLNSLLKVYSTTQLLKIYAFALLCLLSINATAAIAAESCAFCPPFYCENVELANNLKEQKKRAAEQRGLPKRLSALFDALGDCQGCVETAPDWPHLIVLYDGEKMTELHGREIESYQTSRPWQAIDEYKARQDQIAGLVSEFHITLGSKPCRCCKASNAQEYKLWRESGSYRALLDDSLWNDALQTYRTTTVSYADEAAARDIPDDLEEVAPINRVTEPVPGKLEDFNTTAPIRVVQVLCPDCQSLADQYNELGRKLNKLHTHVASLNRDIAYEQAMAEYSRNSISGLNQVANTANVRQKIRDHNARLERAYQELETLGTKLNKAQSDIAQHQADLGGLLDQLINCEATQCLPHESANKIDFPEAELATAATPTELPVDKLEVYTFGGINFSFTNGASQCPYDAGTILISSNNGNPLVVSDVKIDGKLAQYVEQKVLNNNTDTPAIKSIFNCKQTKPKKPKGNVSARVTDTVTSESILIQIGGKGYVYREPKTTDNPNHIGRVGSGSSARVVEWQPLESNCEKCSKITAQYNTTMQQLFQARLAFYQLQQFREDPTYGLVTWLNDSSGASIDLDPETAEGMEVLNRFLSALEYYEAAKDQQRRIILELEQQAKYLQSVISECELQQCGRKGRTKINPIFVDGVKTSDTFQPDPATLFENYDIDWNGPYNTDCLPCNNISLQLNAIPGWLSRAHFKLLNAQMQLEYLQIIAPLAPWVAEQRFINEANESLTAAQDDIDLLSAYYDSLLSELLLCEARYCPNQEQDDGSKSALVLPDSKLKITQVYNCSGIDGDKPVMVGNNRDIGSRANFKDKAKKKALGTAAGAAKKLVGLGGGGGNKDEGPVTYKDPVKKKHKVKAKDKKPKRSITTGATFTDGGLLVSTDIDKAPGKGTFQYIWLENQNGWRLDPINHFLYQLWGEWTLNVSWTKDTYIDGEHVAHEEGAWSESWKELEFEEERIEYREGSEERTPTKQPGINKYPPIIWKGLGFNTAVSGVRGLGTLFPVTPAMLEQSPLDLFIHITEPKKDPVMTFPYRFRLSLGDDNQIETERIRQHTYDLELEEESLDVTLQLEHGPCLENHRPSSEPTTTDEQTQKTQSTFEITPENGQINSNDPIKKDNDKYALDPALTNTPIDDIKFNVENDGETTTVTLPSNQTTASPKNTFVDADNDGIDDSIDTAPNKASDSFLHEEGMTGRIIRTGGHKVTIRYIGDGKVRVQVSDDGSDKPAIIELLGVELEVAPGTSLDADWG